ncbi:hypothetical protein HOG98_04435 [bacterium]|nr:hypothetical protein [bacterium]
MEVIFISHPRESLWVLSKLIFKEFNNNVDVFDTDLPLNASVFVSNSLSWPHHMSCRGVLAISELHNLVSQYIEYMACIGEPNNSLGNDWDIKDNMCVDDKWIQNLDVRLPQLSSIISNGIFKRLEDPSFLNSLDDVDIFQAYINSDFNRDLIFLYYFYNIWFAHTYLFSSCKSLASEYFQFLEKLKPYSDYMYERIISLKQPMKLEDSEKTINMAIILDREIRKFFGKANSLNCMVGIGELENGRLMISVSGSLMESYNILEKLHKFLYTLNGHYSDIDFDTIYLGPPAANTMGFHRFVRFKDSGISVHNGFECVEPKLISGARLLKLKLVGMSVFWMGNSPKRYAKESKDGPFFSYPCPSCVMNLSDISF